MGGGMISFVFRLVVVVVFLNQCFVCSGCYLSVVVSLKLINVVPIINILLLQMYG